MQEIGEILLDELDVEPSGWGMRYAPISIEVAPRISRRRTGDRGKGWWVPACLEDEHTAPTLLIGPAPVTEALQAAAKDKQPLRPALGEPNGPVRPVQGRVVHGAQEIGADLFGTG